MMDPDGDALTYVWIPSLSSGLTFEPSNAPEPDVSYEHPLSPPPLDFGIDYSQFISTVQGRVYVDTNDNGNPDPGEPGLASAQVSVFNFFADDVTAVLTPNTNGDYSAIVTSGDTLEVSPTMLPTGESVRFTQTRSMGCATPSKLAVVRASDGELETAEAFFVRFTDTQAPVITPGAADQTVECDGAGNQAAVTSWLNSNGGAFASESCTSETWSNDFSAFSSGAGAKTVAFTATDECGLSASTSATFTIEDTTPPSITSVTASPDMLWPPNHKMAAVTIQVDASDICDGGAPGCEITAISSNEPINSSDDGDTAPDWEITGPLTANIRAERSGTGTGRTYTLDVTCTDEQGHATVSSTTVTVPLEL